MPGTAAAVAEINQAAARWCDVDGGGVMERTGNKTLIFFQSRVWL
jgi:hypothetical protein